MSETFLFVKAIDAFRSWNVFVFKQLYYIYITRNAWADVQLRIFKSRNLPVATLSIWSWSFNKVRNWSFESDWSVSHPDKWMVQSVRHFLSISGTWSIHDIVWVKGCFQGRKPHISISSFAGRTLLLPMGRLPSRLVVDTLVKGLRLAAQQGEIVAGVEPCHTDSFLVLKVS